MVETKLNKWKIAAISELAIMKALFLVDNISTLFLITLAPASQESLILNGAGHLLSYIVVPWYLLVISALMMIYLTYNEPSPHRTSNTEILIYMALIACSISMVVFGIMTSSVAWPIVMRYMGTTVLGILLVHYKKKIHKMAENDATDK